MKKFLVSGVSEGGCRAAISRGPQTYGSLLHDESGRAVSARIGDSYTGKVVPNLNMSFDCASGTEKFFINLNRRGVAVGSERESLADGTLLLRVGSECDIWRIDENGRLKWDIEFAARPSTNITEWDIMCSPGISFHYQPPLTPEEIARGAARPDEVVGSYAVYSDGRGRLKRPDGSTVVHYAAGKICHIYRPLCVDAGGAEAWAELQIEDGRLRITIPQDFLDSAAYPVTLDPAFGYSTSGGSSGNVGSSEIFASGMGTPASDGTVTGISIYSSNGVAAIDVTVGLYTDSGGPASKVGSENETVDAGTWGAQWKEFATGPLSVTNGSNYFPSCNSSNDFSVYYDMLGGTNRYWDNTVYGSAWPATFSQDSSSGAMYSMYATYSETGGEGIAGKLSVFTVDTAQREFALADERRIFRV